MRTPLILLPILFLVSAVDVRAAPVTVTDAGGNPVTIADASRIVSVGGPVTEILYALGVGDRVVGVDTTSTIPAETEDLPKVGYMRTLSAEGVLSLGATLVIAQEAVGPADVVGQLAAAGVPVLRLPEITSADGLADKVQAIATAVGVPDRGRALARALRDDLARLAEVVATLPSRPSVLFAVHVGRGTPMASGRGTPPAGLLELAGATNAVTGFAGYKPLSPEAAIAAAPSAILLPRSTLDGLGGPDGAAAHELFALTPAGRAQRIVGLDGTLLLGFGPRTPAAVAHLIRAFHPSADLPPDLAVLATGSERQ